MTHDPMTHDPMTHGDDDHEPMTHVASAILTHVDEPHAASRSPTSR